MRKSIVVPLALAGSLCTVAAASAQERMPVPDRATFVAECVPAMAGVAGTDAGGRAFARAACRCSHGWLADRETMSREEFDAAATLCRAEYERDAAAFLRRHAGD